MSQNAKDKLIFLFSGLMIGLGVAAFVYNLRAISVANAEVQPRLSQELTDFKNQMQQKRKDPFSEKFFANDPMKEMQELRNRLWRGADAHSLFPNRESVFGTQNFKMGPLGHFKINQSETPGFLVYEVSMQDAGEGSTMDVNVEDDRVNIRGHRVEESQDKRNQASQSFFSSSTISQSFSLPAGLDTENVIMENQGLKVILKFPKLNSEI